MSAMYSWASELCDYLWMRLQYLDHRKSSLFDTQSDALNPFLRCSCALAWSLIAPIADGPLKTVFSHWPVAGQDL
eukprot:11175906-Lingulodinium_polyedra.AAC.1